MINCLNAHETISKKIKYERRKKSKNPISKFLARRYERQQEEIHKQNLKDLEQINKLLEELKEIDKQRQEELKKEIVKLLEKRARFLINSEDIEDENFEKEIVPLMDLLEYYEPFPSVSEEHLKKDLKALWDKINSEENTYEQEEN